MAVDGSLIFDTKIDTDGFEKGTKELSSKTIDLKNKISSTEAAIKKLRTELEKTGNVKVKTKVAEGLEKDLAKANERVRNYAAQSDEILNQTKADLGGMYSESAMEYLLSQNKEWVKLQDKISMAWAEVEKYENALKRVNEAAPLEKDTAAYQQKEQRLNELTGQLDVYKAKLREAEQAEQAEADKTAAASRNTSNLKKHLQRTISALKMFGGGAAKAGNLLKSAFSKSAGKLIQNIGNRFRKANNQTNVLEKSLRRIKNTLVRMFFFRLVHSPIDAIKDGLGEIAKISPTLNKNLSALKTESTYLKNSLAALAAPLVNLVTPAFVSFMQTISGVLNKTGQLIALLTGQSGFTQAVKVQQDYAESLDESTKSTEKNTKAVKENQKALAGFDELNVLDVSEEDNDDSADAASSVFENVETQVSGLSKSLVDMLKNQDFGSVGELLGEKINEGLSKIKWDKIKVKAKKTAEKVTSFINGFLKKTDWKLVGDTIGSGIATALIFSNTLFGTLDWSSNKICSEICTNLLIGELLDLSTIVTKKKNEVEVEKSPCLSILKTVSMLQEDRLKNPLRVNLANDRILFNYRGANSQYEDECAVSAAESAETVMIGLNNSYLQDTLNACPADSLKVQYDGALSPVLFRSKSEQAEVVQVIVPMRLAAE